MLEFEVTSKEALRAAINAAAQPTYEEAKRNPVRIQFNTTVLTFKEGISEIRARQLIRNTQGAIK